MKKRIFGLTAAVLLLTGCGKTVKLKNGEEAVVTFNNGEKISVDELYKNMKDTYALTSLVSMIDKYVLESNFKDYIDTAKEYAESYVDALRENYDTEEQFVEALQNYMGMSSIKAYEDYMYLNYMQNHATEEYAKLQITEDEIKDYYKNEVVGDIELSHILITPEVTDDMDDKAKEKAESDAKAKAQEIIDTLKNTKDSELSDKFSKLAKEHSNDDGTKKDGGSLGKINKDSLDSNYDELISAAYSIKDGQYYNKVITTELGYHVILRTKSYDKASLEDSKDKILDALANKLIEKDSSIAVNSMQHYRKELGVDIIDSELSKQYSNYLEYQIANSKLNTNN